MDGCSFDEVARMLKSIIKPLDESVTLGVVRGCARLVDTEYLQISIA